MQHLFVYDIVLFERSLRDLASAQFDLLPDTPHDPSLSVQHPNLVVPVLSPKLPGHTGTES